MSKESKKTEELKGKLLSQDEKIVAAALVEAEENGTVAIVPTLIAIYATTHNKSTKETVARLLSELKVSGTESHFIEALSNPELKHIHKDIIGFIWNSNIQPVKEIAFFSNIAIKGSFEEALECITLIDSITTPIPEEVLLESITLVKQHLAGTSKDDKTALLAQYLLALENMRIED